MGSFPRRIILSDYAAEIIEGLEKRHHLTAPEVVDLLCRHELERLRRVLGQKRRTDRPAAPKPATAPVARKPVYLDTPPPEDDDGPLFAVTDPAMQEAVIAAVDTFTEVRLPPPAPGPDLRPYVRGSDDPEAPDWVRIVADDLGSGVSEEDVGPEVMDSFRRWLRGDEVPEPEVP